MPQAEVNGVSLYFEDQGAGAPLLLIAGLASDSASWAPVAPGLGAQHRLLMPDNRGAGRTDYRDQSVTVEAMAEDAAALLDHLSISRAHVLGHSMGALIAATLAARHPDKVDRLILAGSSAKRSGRAAAVMADLAALRATNASAELRMRLFFHWLFAPKFFHDPAAVDEAVRQSLAYPYAPSDAAYLAQTQAAGGFDPSALDRIAAPTLVLSGALDLLTPATDAKESFARLRHHTFQALPGAAHSLHWDEPEAFNAAVLAFLGAAR